MAALGWYSGDLHVHRELDELAQRDHGGGSECRFSTHQLGHAVRYAPFSGRQELEHGITQRLIRVDDQHVIWPRSTEYEIFTVGKQRHTLGALFVLGTCRAAAADGTALETRRRCSASGRSRVFCSTWTSWPGHSR